MVMPLPTLRLSIIFLLVVLFAPLTSTSHADNLPFRVSSSAAVLGDIDSGAILYSHDAETRRPPASLTKVMTLFNIYEALEKGDLDLETKLPVSEKAWRMGGSKTFVRVGDMVRVEDLIRGIAVQSGNDACIVVAEHLGGTEKGFADLMNTKARELGMYNSHFMNASGLPDDDHYSTAYDIFRLARTVIARFPQFGHYTREKQYTYNGIRQYNRNKLLWRDPSITGLKTGHTRAAGYCLIATNDHEGQRMSAVIMGASSSKVREEEALRLLRYGNRMYETLHLYSGNTPIKEFRVWKGNKENITGMIREDLLVTIPRKERSNLEVGLSYKDPLIAPIAPGDQIGTLVVKIGDKEVVSRPVIANSGIDQAGFVGSFIDSARLRMGW
ncbi:MAG: D-alanyl-D-alanine carboxypeptidase [Magnetococcales bacterium]|nr:D-alanyl-D-alanine carboxypeptidase [Magnetococcales bacterium]